ncbi:recombinase family protein [Clostridium butyricum]|uniref:recombinase family protein n=1 Tax=Clostridium butyricum TaxID=1492 RepID=UPI002029CBCD|nr:recombinase family protein [Clostridium butyricum]MCI3009962.1 recombinase family protein [Clostridium butyricum]MDM8130535.1 recombinase family protein [Clostridium butyricum]MDM8229306.1 recombinase family protein [Clostridium butyricum]MDP0842511.1 recombinase family protein [Clostridium butyricum]WLS70355.1 recombinase family protein [Clostridium butyricum]
MLHNEKYKGDAILQKNFTVDFLTKKKKVNEGEVPQYYVENSHAAIISAEVFDLAQAEFGRRRSDRGLRRSNSCFSGKIICGECGGFYGSKTYILIVNIERLYGDAIINTIIMKSAKHHIYMKTSLKNYLLKLLMR